MPGDTVRRLYFRRPRWHTNLGEEVAEGLVLGVVIRREEISLVVVQWEDGGVSRGEDLCFRKVSEEEATALRMRPFNERSLDTERVWVPRAQ